MIYMLKYHPYESDKPGKNIILLPMIIKTKLGPLVCLILQFIKMNKGNNDILIDTKIVMKIGQNLA